MYNPTTTAHIVLIETHHDSGVTEEECRILAEAHGCTVTVRSRGEATTTWSFCGPLARLRALVEKYADGVADCADELMASAVPASAAQEIVEAAISAVLARGGSCAEDCPCTDEIPCSRHIDAVTDAILSGPEARQFFAGEVPPTIDMAGPEESGELGCRRCAAEADLRSAREDETLTGGERAALLSDLRADCSAHPHTCPDKDILRLPLDCAFDGAWSRDEEGKRVHDEDEEDRLASEYASDHGCTAQLLLRLGPAGGNPLYCFFGTRKDLRSLCLAHVGGDGEEADYLMEAAEPFGTPVPELASDRVSAAPSAQEAEGEGQGGGEDPPALGSPENGDLRGACQIRWIILRGHAVRSGLPIQECPDLSPSFVGTDHPTPAPATFEVDVRGAFYTPGYPCCPEHAAYLQKHLPNWTARPLNTPEADRERGVRACLADRPALGRFWTEHRDARVRLRAIQFNAGHAQVRPDTRRPTY